MRTEGSGTRGYDGKVWYKPISLLRTVNGVAVEDFQTPLDKSHLKHSDQVTLDFDGKIFSGVIDLEFSSPQSLPGEEGGIRGESPLSNVGSVEPMAGVCHREKCHQALPVNENQVLHQMCLSQRSQKKNDWIEHQYVYPTAFAMWV